VNPDGLYGAFKLEVICKRPFDFKIDCLTTIRDLFPNKDPFVIGFGNKETDVISYRAVGIKDTGIYIIDKKDVISRPGSDQKITGYSQLCTQDFSGELQLRRMKTCGNCTVYLQLDKEICHICGQKQAIEL